MRMSKYRFYFLTLLLFVATAVFAQSKSNIAVRAFYYNKNVFLRWKLDDAKSYLKCAKDGFEVERRQSGEPWQTVGTVRKGNYVDIDDYCKKNDNGILLKVMLYKEEYLQQLFDENPTADRDSIRRKFEKNIKGSDDDLYEFLLLGSEFSVDVAKFAALNFMDDKVMTQQEYEYRIRPVDSKLKYTSEVVKVSTARNYSLPQMSKLSVERTRENLIFRWRITKEMKEGFAGYELERSADGKKFELVNDVPIIHLVSTKSTKDTCIYTDTLPKCGKTYYYRVRGFSRFGLSGPYSNIVTERCEDDLTVFPKIETIEFNKNGEAEIKWIAENPDNQKFEGFEVQRAADINLEKTGFLSITKRLSVSTTSYVDKKPLKHNFYRILAIGENGQMNYGNIVYATPHDTLPPSIPTGLKGVIDSAGVLTLTWNPNPEPEIRGYKVYFANDSNDVFVSACDTFLKTPQYNDTLFLGSLTNDIYYKVAAVGENYGQSEKSPAIKVVKPDTIAPAVAVFKSVKQDSTGAMIVEWYDSPSTDLAKTVLVRFREKHVGWDTLGVWSGDSTVKMIKDTADFIGENVTYRILVSDESGNESASLDYVIKTQYVKPHCAKDLQVTVDRNLGEIELHWSKCGCNVFMTRIYRIDDGVQRLLVTLEGQETGYIDSKVAIGHTYQYLVLPITKKMSQVEKSEIIAY